MIIASDVEDLFLPTPEDLLVPLVSFRPQIEKLLMKLPLMYSNTQVPLCGLGSALKATRAIIVSMWCFIFTRAPMVAKLLSSKQHQLTSDPGCGLQGPGFYLPRLHSVMSLLPLPM